MATEPGDADVEAYVAAVEHPVRRRDAQRLLDLMGRISDERPRMWGSSIVGFGQYHYRYPSGREGDGPTASFSPRKAAITVYLPDGVGPHADELARLGAHTTGKGCLYLKDLDAVDLRVLEGIVRSSYETVTDGVFGSRAEG
ncbi:Domain of unknown function DUF1801 [Beutenbergia cavernae DSM 12333]|uniref:YdhG-like domain-containing protein n=1 Tax=Beutenbergia cavernae (strain ATCC BAA-8 / DSM 12333 / CCUG 43141 / JCM 11478 / NBRC 16432 / NCIMB 13614 / HKI 0122) TaxID=471853 RepID=C5BV24_BEUC1|nr:DUF1801 domain-containing protein [Beutenbergia cavernae]ACQ78398.1 Domain of unknown function DUF1801 [Beutenbergia cavernae DSM 12333]